MIRELSACTLAAIACSASGTALGQPDVPPAIEPSTTPRATPAAPASPLRGFAGGKLLPEGSFVVSRGARLVEAPTGDWLALYVDQGGPEQTIGELGPMIIVPSRTLERILQTREDEQTIVELTGRVLLYHGRNYLLPTSFGIRARPEREPDAPGQDNAQDNAPDNAPNNTPEAESPELERLLQELGAINESTRPAISPAQEQASDGVPVVGEGTNILRRRARVEREADGGWTVNLDSDGDELASLSATRYRLVPGSVLQRVESTAARLGTDFPLIVTGKTLTYGDEVYLLLSSFVIEPISQVGPTQ